MISEEKLVKLGLGLINKYGGAQISWSEKRKLFNNSIFKKVWKLHYDEIIEQCKENNLSEPDEEMIQDNEGSFIRIYTLAIIILGKVKPEDDLIHDNIMNSFGPEY